jgi:diphthamide synthase
VVCSLAWTTSNWESGFATGRERPVLTNILRRHSHSKIMQMTSHCSITSQYHRHGARDLADHSQVAALRVSLSYRRLIQAAAPRQYEGMGGEPTFPIWTTPDGTPALADRILASGLGAALTGVDPKQLSEQFVGRKYDEMLLAELSTEIDPCGERGEFHTFCSQCPEFSTEIPVSVGDVIERDGFWFADLRLKETIRQMTQPGVTSA